MIKIYGASDDLVEIEGSTYCEDEIGCFDSDVRILFSDGGIIRIGYCKPNLGVWYIVVEQTGTESSELIICEDEDADIYSDIFMTEAEVISHELFDREAADGTNL